MEEAENPKKSRRFMKNGDNMSKCLTGRAKSDFGSGKNRITKGFVIHNVVTSNSSKPTYSELKTALEKMGFDPNGICCPDWFTWE